MTPVPWRRLGVALAAGVTSVVAFAPLSIFPLAIASIAILAWMTMEARNTREAAVSGFAYGLGLFLAGVGWVYVALSQFGGMPFWLAAPATTVFAAYLALFPAAACVACSLVPKNLRWIAFPASWTLTEWLRGWLFTGFPWLSLGYSQVPSSPLAELAPVLGVFGVSYACAQLGACAAACAERSTRGKAIGTALAVSALVIFAGLPAWTHPASAPISVTLVQGNIAQDLKFREDRLLSTLSTYARFAEASTSRLTVLPETALPLFLHELPAEYLARLGDHARARDGDLIVGIFENDPVGSDRYFNSVLSLGQSERQVYRKHHLVPFGEFIPLKGILAPIINDWLHIPLSDQARGDARQRPLHVAGQQVAMNICYEDVFGSEIIRQLPAATLLANVSNDAWYGRSWAADQHAQIAQMRAKETGRWMLRSTNTGVTAIIDDDGRIRARLPQFVEGHLDGEAQGRTGATPYVLAGNWAVVLLAAVSFGATLVRARSRQPSGR